MMKLAHQSEAARRHAGDVIEAFDDIRLPERPVGIQRPCMQPSRLDAKLPPVAGFRQRDVPHVKFQVEIRVVYPVRMIQAHGHGHDALAERARFVQAFLEEPQDVLERHRTAGSGRLVIDSKTADVHRHIARLQVKERCVES